MSIEREEKEKNRLFFFCLDDCCRLLMMKCIVLICGPPACLKSTLVKLLRLIFNEQEYLSLRYFCKRKFDDLLVKIQNNIVSNFLLFDQLFIDYEKDIIENEYKWKFYRLLIANEIERRICSIDDDQQQTNVNLKYASQILERLNQSLGDLKRDDILFIEDNFYYSSMRTRYRQIAQRAELGFVVVHLYSSLPIAIQRNQQREPSNRVEQSSIENIFSKYEFNDEDLIINTNDYGLTIEDLRRLFERIKQACLQPEQRRREPEINEQNFVHQIDQKLRKFVSKYLKEQFECDSKFQSNNEKKSLAETINQKRQEFFELIRRNLLTLNENENIEDLFKEFLGTI